ncbi:hypothetical protein ACOSP6_14580 [Tenacibaculum sp. MEBiC06402]|uniref:hypothetical protein n=1 Tax=unclassified Tenacibaculum TaxID=2635139 RepID=UPI003B99716B
MKISNLLLLFITTFSILSCTTNNHNYPIEKEYWDINDYDKAILDLRFGYQANEPKPTLDNPEKRIIVEKLIDKQNYKIILDDSTINLRERNKFAHDFFDQWREMTSIYNEKGADNKYIYGKELLAVWHFGLEFHMEYFTIGNNAIHTFSANANNEKVINRVNHNMNELVKNFSNYMDLIKEEDAFYENEKEFFIKGIDTYFTKLIMKLPEANYERIEKKATSVLKKIKSKEIRASLESLIETINFIKLKKSNV